MRPLVILLLALPAACTDPVAPPGADQPDPASRARQEAACTAAILDHINHRPRGPVSTSWIAAEGSRARVAVRDGDRLHLCHVDAAGQVLGYEHPGA